MNKKKMALIFCVLTCLFIWITLLSGYTNTIDTSLPRGTDDPREADDNMRRIQAGFQEILAVEHNVDLTGTEITGDGKHTDITADSITLNSGGYIAGGTYIDVSEHGAGTSESAADNTTAIQAALDAAHTAGGGIVFVPEGTFSTNQLSLYDNTILTGTGNGSVLILNDIGSAQHLLLIGDGEEYVTIQHLKLDGDKANNNYDNETVIRNYGGNHVTVQNCHVTGGYLHGIWFAHGGIDNLAVNNWVDDCDNGITVASNGSQILGNSIIACTTTGINLESGTGDGHNDGVIVSGNKIDGAATTSYGIRLGGGTYAGSDIQITNNTVFDCTLHGLSTQTSDNEDFENILVGDNTCTGNTRYGISITPDSSHTFVDSTISGNICNDNLYNGLYLNRLEHCTVNNNTCSSNGVGSTYSGIIIAGSSTESLFQGNSCHLNTDNGIEETASCSLNFISGNYTLGNTNAEIDPLGTNTITHHNIGWTTENSGTATLLDGQTTVVVTHSLSAAPTVVNINWRENPTNAISDWWIDTIGATTFKLNGANPGASNLDFGWEAKVR